MYEKGRIVRRVRAGGMLPGIAVAVVLILLFSAVISAYGSEREKSTSQDTIRGNGIALTRKSITVDGSAADWTGTAPGTEDTGEYSANEWIWNDENDDLRDPTTAPLIDLYEMRMTGDGSNLYFLFTFQDVSEGTGGFCAPLIMVAIDKDRTTGSGSGWYPLNAFTSVNDPNDDDNFADSSAAWEYCVVIADGAGVDVWSDSSTKSSDNAGSVVYSTTNNLVEASVPWSALNIDPGAGAFTLRITVAVFVNDGYYSGANAGNVNDWGGAGTTDARDCLDNAANTPNGDWDEFGGDQDVDTSYDINFATSGEPVPELSDAVLPMMGMLLVAVYVRRRKA